MITFLQLDRSLENTYIALVVLSDSGCLETTRNKDR